MSSPGDDARSQPRTRPMVVIGHGHMGGAIVAGALRSGLIAPADLTIVEPSPEKSAHIAAQGARVEPTITRLANSVPAGAAVLLAVKPQSLGQVAAEIRQLAAPLNASHLLISILAGVPIARLTAELAPASEGGPSIIRAMPSLPASVGQGCTAICHGPAISPHDAAYAERLFLSTGPVVVETPEPMMDAFTALAGSGPAYVFYLAEALTKAARQQGFEPEAAAAIVRQTIIGAARLLEERDQPPQALREAVTSKGGTTAAACAKLDELGVMDAFNRAIAAGTARARELGAVAGGPPKA